MAEETDYSKALEIVNRYYQKIVEEMAHEICEREDSIMDGGFGWMEIEDRYANKFFNISQIYCNLKKFSTTEAEEEEAQPAPTPMGIAASRLMVDERVCSDELIRETIEDWLEESGDAVLWDFRVHRLEDGESACLFFYSV